MPTVVSCANLAKTYGATKAVNDVGFDLGSGEILALVGENGAGKSTLMNMLAGVVAPDAGHITIAEPVAPATRQVAMVHQELSLFDNLTVAENLELDSAETSALIDERRSRQTAREILDRLGVNVDVDATVGDLSLGQRQLVEVAKAVARPPVLLILDEPTSSLEAPQVDLLFAAVQDLAQQGTATIFVSHRLEELFRLCDRTLVMRDGRVVATGAMTDFTRSTLVTAMVGREASDLFPPRQPRSSTASPAVEGRGLRLSPDAEPIDFVALSGEVTALAGLEGHGQTPLAEVIAGVRRPYGGELLIGGEPVRFTQPRKAVRHGVGYVPPNRRLDGLLLDKGVDENVVLASAPVVLQTGVYSRPTVRGIVQPVADRLAIRAHSLAQPVIELSGGNQQKVVVGRWMLDPDLKVLVLNDPTRGVDVVSRSQIYDVVRGLADRGVAVILVSTDMLEILGLADRIHVMYTGRITGSLDAVEATEQAIMHLATETDADA